MCTIRVSTASTEFFSPRRLGQRPKRLDLTVERDAVTGSSRCYRANLDGKFYGHCGGNPTDGYIPCEEANVMCGKLQCLSPLDRPTVSRAWRSATYRVGSETCRSVSVTVEDDERDPGLVGDGTTCGNGMICILNKCVDVPTASAQCPRDDAGQLCSNNGICSSAGTCVCSDGFTSDDCSGKLGGGNAGVIAGVVVTLILLLLILLVLVYFYPNTFFRPCPSLRPGCLEKGDGASSSYNLSQRAPSNNGKSAARAPPAKPPPPPPSSRPPARPRPPVPLRPNNVYNKPVNA
ncbi:disintegrin and metalloproteinase domain-containing protein 15-like [Oscarella lobularis]|uniref:disintegrin and metalloproteinase domain-containing protein 15-like n=1 Tax=Oscarella lobularis TaxID=121494 RepID=UPI003313BE9F